MIHNPRPIAILLAAYNAEKYLDEQIHSLLAQTCNEWTLYIRNDDSTDATQQIIDSYTERYPEKIIQIDKNGSNLGCAKNFYRLFDVIESKYYMFCDQDDVWFDNKIEVSLDVMIKAENEFGNIPIVAFCDDAICDEKLNVIVHSRWKNARINPEKFLSYNYLAVSCNAAGANSIYNQKVKELLAQHHNDNIIYDFWIAITVAKFGGKLKVIHQPLRYYRQHDNQVYGVSFGAQNKLMTKLLNIRTLIKQYHWEAQHHKEFGYGPHIKYYWYKLLTILKIRFSTYK